MIVVVFVLCHSLKCFLNIVELAIVLRGTEEEFLVPDYRGMKPEAEFLDEIQTKVSFPPCYIHSHLYSFALRFLFISPWLGDEAGGRILGRNLDKSLNGFPPCCIHSHLYSFALRFLFVQT